MIFRCVSNKNARGKLSKTEVVQFWNVRSFGLFCADLRPFYTLFTIFSCIFCSFSWRKAKTTSDVQKRSHIEKNCSRSKQKRNDLEIFGHQSCGSARPLFGNKTPLTPAKPGVLICLGNYATVYHFQRHFLEVKSCLFRPFFTSFYATLRLFTPLLRIFPPLLHM